MKRIIQDVIVKKKFSIKGERVSLEETEIYKEKKGPMKKETADSVIIKEYKKPYFPERSPTFKEEKESDKLISKNSQIFLWIISIASLATLIFFISSIFSSATLTITPKNESVLLNDSYFISNKQEVDGIHFKVLNFKKDLSQVVPTDGEENVERKATGKAVLYNDYSAVSQRLIINTRLQALDGRVYRIQDSVEIPGIKTVSGVKTPGSVEVNITADDSGPDYNMKLSDLKGDFKIPGFKGLSKYEKLYGRLSTDITGGFIGKVKKVSPEKLTSARVELKSNLNNELLKNVYEKLPSQFILFRNDFYISMNDGEDITDKEEYSINETGEINAIIFDKAELAQYLANDKIKKFDNSKVDVRFADDFDATITGQSEKLWNENSLKVKFNGKTDFIWQYDKEEILNEIKGQTKSVIKAVLDKNKNSIVEIISTIRPSWKKSFPENVKKIEVIDTITSPIK